MGKVISVLNLKGGAGKTTISTNLAVAYALEKKNVLLLDTDKSAAAMAWSGRRDQSLCAIRVLQITDPQSLQKQIAGIVEEHDVVIIDGSPHLELMSKTTALVSDIIIIPMQPSAFDMLVTMTFIESIKELMVLNPKIRPFLLLNNGKADTLIIRDIEQAVKELDIPILNSEVNNLVAFAEVATAGQGILELRPNRKLCHAQGQIKALHKEIKKRSK